MKHYILIHKLKIQNANAIAGFTWGFPAITHFLGYTQNLKRKLSNEKKFKGINLQGCAVIAHEHQVHCYKGKYGVRFTQSRSQPYLDSHKKEQTPPIIEEGKMNMTLSLLINSSGNIGNRKEELIEWLKQICSVQRLAGGSVTNENINVEIYSVDTNDTNDTNKLHLIKNKLLPGFVLMDRSNYLKLHFDNLTKENPDTELIDAWIDFSSLKKRERPKFNLISDYLEEQKDRQEFLKLWQEHLEKPYSIEQIPKDLSDHLDNLKEDTFLEMLKQWKAYKKLDKETEDLTWEYINKPFPGYLVPLMIGYKAISKEFEPKEIKNTRDQETPVCFVEAVHSLGEWMSVHRIKTIEELKNTLWHYHYEEEWYLCKQEQVSKNEKQEDSSAEQEHSFY